MVNRPALGAVAIASLTLAAVMMGNPSTVKAEPVPDTFFFPTGNAERDINTTRFPDAVIVLDNPRFPNDLTNDVAQQKFITDSGGLSGWNLRDVRFAYNPANDTAGFAVNFFKNPDGTPRNIAGDVDGNFDPGTASPQTLQLGGIDLPDLSGREALVVGIDTNKDGTVDVVAGIPTDKSGRGVDAFTVANFRRAETGIQPGIERSFGTTLPQHLGQLAYNPSRERPDFEFTITNFSKLPNLTPTRDPNGQLGFSFVARGFAGTLDDVVSGEDLFIGQFDFTPTPIPEPITYPLMAMLVGVAAWRLRRRSV